ncbi:MAG TPA: hypothetical protein VF773_05120 [Verrucomicrobiae bacterium]
MKTLLSGFCAASLSLSALAQGTIQFSTFNSARGVNAPVYAPGLTSAGTGIGETFPGITAQLFLITGTGAGAAYTPLTPATTFNPGPGAASRYVVVPTSNVIVPGVPAGGSATILMRVFNGATYESSTWYGQTAQIVVSNLGGIPPGGGAPLQPAVLAGLQGFEIIPEPATTAFALLAVAALVSRQRK